MEFRDKDFENEKVILDGNTFSGCTFRNCEMIFRADGGPPRISACGFIESPIVLDGPALQTILFPRGMYTGGIKPPVDAIIEGIRTGKGLPPLQS